MTYCLGLLLNDGIVMLADTRTNAGMDNIAKFGKLHVVEVPGERVFALMTAGNLSVAQSIVNILGDGIVDEATGEIETLYTVPSMFRAAQLVGKAVRAVYEIDGRELQRRDIPFDVGIILGGQIMGRGMRLYEIYSAGNFFEATADTPFLQIGENKYGKPILDRMVEPSLSLSDGVTLALLSMDATLRSNLMVGLPADLAVIARDKCRVVLRRRITEHDKGFQRIRRQWSDVLRAAYFAVDKPDWLKAANIDADY